MESWSKNLGTFCHRTGDWSLFRERLDQALILYDEKILSPERKRAFLLNNLTEETFSLLSDLCFPKKVSETTFEELCKFLTSHCKPIHNVYESRELFYRCKQSACESVKDFAAKLKKTSLLCNFEQRLESCLKDIFVIGLFNEKMKHKLFMEALNKPFSECVNLASTWEHVLAIDSSNSNVNTVQKFNTRKNRRENRSSDRNSRTKSPFKSNSNKACFICNKTNHLQKDCWFKMLQCNLCKKSGHTSKNCNNKKERVNSMYAVSEPSGSEPIYVNLGIDNISLRLVVDTGASVNAISYKTYMDNFSHKVLVNYKKKLFSYDNNMLNVVGKMSGKVVFNNKCVDTEFIVIKNGSTSIVGRNFLKCFGVKLSGINLVNNEEVNHNIPSVLKLKFPKVFSDKPGRFKNYEANIEVRSDFRPKFINPRPIPYSIRDKVESELLKMLNEGILEKVEISDMASPIVIVKKKDGSIRICTDFKNTLNPMLAPLKYPLPRIEDLISSLNGAKYFAKIDLRNAFTQISLNERSRKLCVISTHIGLFAYKVLPFGLTTSPAIFMQIIASIMGSFKNVRVFLDDILLFGNSKEELDSVCETVLKKLSDCGLTVNESKCYFYETEIEYLGFKISQEGIMPLDDKIEAIKQLAVPRNVSELRSLLGAISYYRMFIRNISDILSPLYSLLKKGSEFLWSEECNVAFNLVKEHLMSDNILVHFNPLLPIKLITDASNIGISAMLCHVYENGIERPIAYASRTLSDAERKYSILDKEACAIIFGLKRFFQFLYGKKFILSCDNKSLVHILDTNKQVPVLAANRLQRYALILQTFDYSIEYIKSGDNKADFLSRLPMQSENSAVREDCSNYFLDLISDLNTECIESDHLNIISTEMEINAEAIKISSEKDTIISSIINYLNTGWPEKKNLNADLLKFWYMRDKLSVHNACLFYNNKLVIPGELKESVLKFIHQSHLGIVKSKCLARNYFFWLGMNADIEVVVRQCIRCAECVPTPTKVQLASWPVNNLIFNRVHIDFLGPFGNLNFLIVVDATTKWIDCVIVPKVDSDGTIKALKKMFSIFGIPEKIVSDNGTAFTSATFQKFCRDLNIESVTSAVQHPASNGLAENAVKTVKNFLKKILVNNKFPIDLEDRLLTFLVDIRNTPSICTGIEPSVLMLGRKIRSVYNTIVPKMDNDKRIDFKKIDDKVKNKMLISQNNQKKYYRGKKFKKFFEIGSKVLTKDFRNNKNKWILGTVIQRLGSRIYMVKIKSTGQIWKRHHDQLTERKVNWGESDNSDKVLDFGPLSEVDLTNPNSHVFSRSHSPWRERLRPRGPRPRYPK